MQRRAFVAGMMAGAAWSLVPRPLRALGPSSRFRVARLVLPECPPARAGAERRLVWEVLKRTSVAGELEPLELSPEAPELFEQPFLVFAGEQAYPPLSEDAIARLQRYLLFGGFLFADNCGGPSGSGFDASFRRTVARLFPRRSLKPLGADHTVYRSFYLLDRPHGRVQNRSYLEGVDHQGRTSLVYSGNDLPGAWLRDDFGDWKLPVLPGGEWQRERALRLGVNLVLYALCLDYKRDQVHVETLMRRRRWRSED